jgi:hypothetical protein
MNAKITAAAAKKKGNPNISSPTFTQAEMLTNAKIQRNIAGYKPAVQPGLFKEISQVIAKLAKTVTAPISKDTARMKLATSPSIFHTYPNADFYIPTLSKKQVPISKQNIHALMLAYRAKFQKIKAQPDLFAAFLKTLKNTKYTQAELPVFDNVNIKDIYKDQTLNIIKKFTALTNKFTKEADHLL